MPTLNIKDERVYELASQLAQQTGASMTAVVRIALEEALATHAARQERASVDDLLAIAARSAARPEPFLTDDDLYDPETGLPW